MDSRRRPPADSLDPARWRRILYAGAPIAAQARSKPFTNRALCSLPNRSASRTDSWRAPRAAVSHPVWAAPPRPRRSTHRFDRADSLYAPKLVVDRRVLHRTPRTIRRDDAQQRHRERALVGETPRSSTSAPRPEANFRSRADPRVQRLQHRARAPGLQPVPSSAGSSCA